MPSVRDVIDIVQVRSGVVGARQAVFEIEVHLSRNEGVADDFWRRIWGWQHTLWR